MGGGLESSRRGSAHTDTRNTDTHGHTNTDTDTHADTQTHTRGLACTGVRTRRRGHACPVAHLVLVSDEGGKWGVGRAVAGHTHARRLFRNVTMIFSRPRSECSGRRQDTDCVTGLCSLKQGVEMAPGGIGRRLVLGGSPLQCQGRCVLAAPRPRSALAGDRPLHRLLPGRSHRSVLWFRATVLLLPATLRVRSPPRAGGELPCSALRARAARAACHAWRRRAHSHAWRGGGAPAGSPLLVPWLLHGPARASSQNGGLAPGTGHRSWAGAARSLTA